MLKKFVLLSSALSLGACAYALEDSIQDVQFVTPGATGAQCYVYVKGLRHVVYPPETITLGNAGDDLKVDCWAPGNRRQTIFVRPQINRKADLNILNGGVGYAWDHASGALYQYPQIIEINFTDTPTKPAPPPFQNAPDIRQPETYSLEEFSAGEPKLNRDQYNTPPELRRRGEGASFDSYDMNDGSFYEPSGNLSGKGDLQNIPGQ